MQPPEISRLKSLQMREARLKRAAARQGLAIVTSGNGRYRIVDPQTQAVVHTTTSGDDSLTISQAEAFLGDPKAMKSIDVANLNAANDE